MTIILHVNCDIDPNIAKLILNKELKFGYSIDYALNSLMSFYQNKEIIVFNFSKYLQLDNRFSGYHIEDYVTKIIINFT